MSTIATLAVKLVGDATGLRQTMSESTQSVKSSIDSMTSFGSKLTAGVTLPIVGLGIAAIKGAADQEQLQIAFTTMLGSAEKATSLIKDLQQFSASTPFEMPEVVTAGKQLLAYGIDADKVQSTLTMLGDVASGVGAPIGDLAYLFGTASASGRLMTADINQFTNRGIPMIKALAQVMGVSETSIKDMAAAGKIGAVEMNKAFEYMTGAGGQFNNMMAAQSVSIYGMASTLKDNLGMALTAVGTKLIEVFNLGGSSGVIAQMLVMTEKIKDSILGLADSNPVLFKMIIMFGLAAAAVGPLLVGLGWLASLFVSGGLISSGVAALGVAFGLLTSPIMLVAGAVALLAAAIYNDWGGIGTFAARIWGQVSNVISDAADWVLNLADTFAWYIDTVKDAGFGSIETTEAIGLFPTSIQPAVMWLDQLGGALGAIRDYFVAVVEDGDYMNDWLTHLPDSIQPAVEWLGRLTAATMTLFNGQDFASLVTGVTTAFSDIGTAISDYFSGDISIGGLAGAVSQGFTDISTALSTFFGGQDFSAFLGTIKWAEFIDKLSWENVLATSSLIWTDYIEPFVWVSWATILDWATYISPITWAALVTVMDWATYIGTLAWTDYIAPFLWDTWLVIVDWSTYIGTLAWDGFISLFTWDNFLTVLDWAMWIPALLWTGFIQLLEWTAYLAVIVWSAFISVLDWATTAGEGITWADFISALEWTSYILAFAWDSFISKLEWTGTITKLESWGDYITSIDWASYVTALTTWADYIEEIAWSSFINLMADWGTYIKELNWGGFLVMMLDWSLWIPALIWNGFVALIDWGVYLASLDWTSFINVLSWIDFIAENLSWGTFIAVLAWSDFVPAAFAWGTYVGSLLWSSYVSFISWSNFVKGLAWDLFIPKLTWPTIPAFPGWGAFVSAITGAVGGNALGTESWRGGFSMVGEAGPEMVYLPKGTQVRSASQTRRYTGGGGVVIQNVYVQNEQDAYAMAYKMDDLMKRREAR